MEKKADYINKLKYKEKFGKLDMENDMLIKLLPSAVMELTSYFKNGLNS